MQDIKIIFNVNHSKKEISIICENDNHFNRTWKLKGEIDFEKCITWFFEIRYITGYS